jgi:hypothetical protein
MVGKQLPWHPSASESDWVVDWRTVVPDRDATVSNIGTENLLLPGLESLCAASDGARFAGSKSLLRESQKSKRRLNLPNEILAQVQAHMRRLMPDRFAAFKCLDDFDPCAGDAPFIAAASHDKAASRKSPGKDQPPGRTAALTATKYATGHICSLGLRSRRVTHLTVSDQVARKKEHDMRALKRQDIQTLRQGTAKGRRGRHIRDRAVMRWCQRNN